MFKALYKPVLIELKLGPLIPLSTKIYLTNLGILIEYGSLELIISFLICFLVSSWTVLIWSVYDYVYFYI